MAIISAFEVPADQDEAFAAGRMQGTLYRAIREDVAFRFVNVVDGDSRDQTGFPSHSATYEVVHDEGAVDGNEGVVLINFFEVPPGADDAFTAGWHRAREFLAAQRGYLGTRLHRSTSAAEFHFVNIARWSSPLMFARALQRPEFQETSAALPFPSHPALYDVIRG